MKFKDYLSQGLKASNFYSIILIFLQLGVLYYCLAVGHQIEVNSEKVTAREPDLVVHSEASAAAILQDGRLLRVGQPVPALVVEVASNSDTDLRSPDRDYIDKRREDSQLGIPEYWLVDPMESVILIFKRVGKEYQENQFMGDEQLISPGFPALKLHAVQILKAGL